MVKDSILGKLCFAKKRLDEICQLAADGKISVEADMRQQLAQEFFFHLLGAVDYLAQLINEQKNLGMTPNEVLCYKVKDKLWQMNSLDQLVPILKCMSVNTKKEPFPSDPFSDSGLVYRLINYRNETVHRNTNPFHFTLSKGPAFAEFWLDPRDHSIGKTGIDVGTDLNDMYDVIEKYINQAFLYV